MTDLSIMKPFVGMSRKDISTFATITIQNAVDNEEDALNLVAIGSKIEQLGKELKDKGSKHEYCLKELLRQDNKKIVTSNVELSIREVGTKYDYSATPIIEQIEKEITRLKAEQDVIKDVAKIIKTRTEYTTSDGEQIIIMPAGKSSTTSIVTKIL